MRRVIFVVLIYSLLSLLPANAQEAVTSIIALKDGIIYAFNPADDSIKPLVLAPDHYDEIAENNRQPVVLTSADWLSPDGQYLAYRVIEPTNPGRIISAASVFTQELFILDLQNPDQPIAIDLDASESHIESVAWSLDNTRLYVLANNAVHIVERADWTVEKTVDVGGPHQSQAPVISRRIFASDTGVVLVDATDGRELVGIDFTVFSADGNQLNTFKADYGDYPDTTFYNPLEPIELDGVVHYGFPDNYNTLLYLANFAPDSASDIESYTQGYATIAMVSRNTAENSLRVTAHGYDISFDLSIFDADDNWIADIPQVHAYQFGGYSGDHFGTRFALSPDGQSLAYLGEQGLVLWHDGESVKMDFVADVIIWSAPMYVTVDLPQ